MMKVCCRCKQQLSIEEFHRRPDRKDGRNGACKSCICSYKRTHRAGNQELYRAFERRRNRQRVLAKQAVKYAIRTGKLQRQPCHVCGCPDAQAHHPAYSLPLAVTWLCEKHHNQLHYEHDKALRARES